MADWRPIETAPRMKTLLLFAATDLDEGGRVRNWKMATGFWHCGFEEDGERSPWHWDGHQLRKYEIQPTHWRELPEPPTQTPREREGDHNG